MFDSRLFKYVFRNTACPLFFSMLGGNVFMPFCKAVTRSSCALVVILWFFFLFYFILSYPFFFFLSLADDGFMTTKAFFPFLSPCAILLLFLGPLLTHSGGILFLLLRTSTVRSRDTHTSVFLRFPLYKDIYSSTS